jgi:hypothetical protein
MVIHDYLSGSLGEKEREGRQGQNIPFKDMPQWPPFLPKGSTYSKQHHFAIAGDETFSIWTLGDISGQEP